MGYPKTNMVFNGGTADAISTISAATVNKALKLKTPSRTFAYMQIALAACWVGNDYKGPFDGRWTQDFADQLDEEWNEAFGSNPVYAKDAQGNYPLAFIRDFLNGDTRYAQNGADYPPVVA